jgi:hypothetical protein
MRRFVTTLALAGLLAVATAAGAQAARRASETLHFTVRITQGPTWRYPHPPAGDAGDVFSTTLTIFADGSELGKPANSKLGTMTFSYTMDGSCSSTGAGCNGSTNIETKTSFPGGTLTADGLKVPLSHVPYVVPIQTGTGRFTGATGSIAIAPNGQAETIFTIKLP